MDRGKNLLLGIVLGIVIVGATVYATGLGKRLLLPFRGFGEYQASQSPAPEFATGNWINSEPTKLKDLRGRVVLIEFWTFGCINCRNTLPYVKSWDKHYREKGLTVIGVHSPEFAVEREIEHLRREVASLEIKYPIITDNDYQTWNAYNVEAWPTLFLLDKQGRIRWRHVGEGGYDETEKLIQKLLAEQVTQ